MLEPDKRIQLHGLRLRAMKQCLSGEASERQDHFHAEARGMKGDEQTCIALTSRRNTTFDLSITAMTQTLFQLPQSY